MAPMSEVMKNPPGTSYYQALVGLLAGFSERAIHLGMLPIALAMIAGVVLLARRFAGDGLLAAVLVLGSPAALVSATNAMSDLMMLALWVWAVLFWIWGIDRGKPAWLIAGGCTVAAAALTKYPAIALIPLLGAYGLLRRRSWCWPIATMMIPVAALFAYQLWTVRLYAHGLVTDAIAYPTAVVGPRLATWQCATTALAFVGGGTLGPVVLLAWRSTIHMWATYAIASVVALAVAWPMRCAPLTLFEFVAMTALGWVLLVAT